MINKYSINDLIAISLEREFSNIDDVPLPEFSRRHKAVMKKAFRIFERNISKAVRLNRNKASKNLSFRKRFVVAVAVVICLAFIMGCVIAFISKGFKGTVYSDNTYLFAVEVGDSPHIIENKYSLSVLPEGYELYEVVENDFMLFAEYRSEKGKILIFQQSVKEAYNSHINTEGYEIEVLTVNGCEAVCMEYTIKNNAETRIIWNNEKYILSLYGSLSKEDMLDLAVSNEKLLSA